MLYIILFYIATILKKSTIIMATPGQSLSNAYTLKLWQLIFKKDDWLKAAIRLNAHPLLIYHPEQANKSLYIVLLDMDWSGDLQYEPVKLRDCLNDHQYNAERGEARFHNADITLYIQNPGLDHTCLGNLQQIIHNNSSFVLLYKASEPKLYPMIPMEYCKSCYMCHCYKISFPHLGAKDWIFTEAKCGRFNHGTETKLQDSSF